MESIDRIASSKIYTKESGTVSVKTAGGSNVRLTIKERQKATKITAARYQKASKKQKGIILGEFIALTGHGRCYGSYLLKNHGKKVWINNRLVAVGDICKRHKRQRHRTYGDDVLRVLRQIWVIMDCICGKRLRPTLKEMLTILQKYREIRVTRETKKKLLQISAATIDRLLRQERKKYELKEGLLQSRGPTEAPDTDTDVFGVGCNLLLF